MGCPFRSPKTKTKWGPRFVFVFGEQNGDPISFSNWNLWCIKFRKRKRNGGPVLFSKYLRDGLSCWGQCSASGGCARQQQHARHTGIQGRRYGPQRPAGHRWVIAHKLHLLLLFRNPIYTK